jgi:hypothetical protein
MEFVYDRGWQERWWEYAVSLTDAEWLMYHDADEVFHEDDIVEIRATMARPEIELISFPYLHFYMTPRWTRNFYPHNTRLGRRSAGYRMRNWCSDETPNWPACQMVFGPNEKEAHGHRGPNIAVLDTPFYHYSWCRDTTALRISQMKHVDWYRDGERFGLTDGSVPDVEPHDFLDEIGQLVEQGRVQPYDGPHPAIMRDWFASHETQWAQLEEACRSLA